MTWGRRWAPAAVLPLLLVVACDSGSNDEPAPPPTGAPGTTVTVELADRPFQLHVPETPDPSGSAPLVVLLHGYTSSATKQEDYFQLTAESDRRGFLYAMPDGTAEAGGNRFWNATAACCNFRGSDVDDVGYLRRLIETVAASYPVDPARVYLVGHSNGGFMAYRMACDEASMITAVVSLAGAPPNDPSACQPARPVSILQIHGTADATIGFDGGANGANPFPSVATTLEMWRGHNGCRDDEDETADPMDLDSGVAGPETTVTTYRTGCGNGTRVELWTITDGGHVPALTPDFAAAVTDFLYAT